MRVFRHNVPHVVYARRSLQRRASQSLVQWTRTSDEHSGWRSDVLTTAEQNRIIIYSYFCWEFTVWLTFNAINGRNKMLNFCCEMLTLSFFCDNRLKLTRTLTQYTWMVDKSTLNHIRLQEAAKKEVKKNMVSMHWGITRWRSKCWHKEMLLISNTQQRNISIPQEKDAQNSFVG